MGISIGWINDEKTIMLHQYVGSWTLAEIITHLDRVYEMIDTVEHSQQVDIIADVHEIGYPPSGMLTRGLSYYRKKRHPAQGIQVIVGKTFLLSFMRGLTNIAARVIPQVKNVRFVDTIDEAFQYIETYRVKQHG